MTATPHDALFKAAFSKPHHARGLLRELLPAALEDLLDADEDLLAALGANVPRFRFLLDDLSVQSDGALRARRRMTPGGRAAILSLKHGRDPIAVRIRVLSPDGRAARDVPRGHLAVHSGDEPGRADRLRNLLARQFGRKEAEKMLTTAERLRTEGRAEGRTEGKREVLLQQLRQRFGRVPAVTVARVGKAGASELDTWLSRVLTAESLDEVLPAKPRRKA